MKSRLKHWHRKCITNDRLRSGQKSKPLIGYMRVSKADGSQVLDLQHDGLGLCGFGGRLARTEQFRAEPMYVGG